MPNWITNSLRPAVCLTAALCLTACGTTTTNVNKSEPVALSKGTATDSAGSLYTGQVPKPPQADEVIRMLEQAVADAPRDAIAYLRLGVAYRHVENFDEAMRVFEQAAQLSEQPHLVQNEIGILYRAQGDFKQAEKVYLDLLAADPAFHDAHYNLGILYDLYLKSPLNAQKHYQAYINNAPEADERVEKWLVDLERRYQIGENASAGVVGD